jgi:TctA family transporter
LKKDGVWAILAGILITMLVLLVVVRFLFPNDVILLTIPMYVAMIVLWLNAYRVSRKKQAGSSVNPSI